MTINQCWRGFMELGTVRIVRGVTWIQYVLTVRRGRSVRLAGVQTEDVTRVDIQLCFNGSRSRTVPVQNLRTKDEVRYGFYVRAHCMLAPTGTGSSTPPPFLNDIELPAAAILLRVAPNEC